MLVCSSCHADNRDDAKFCEQCGATLGQNPAEPVIAEPAASTATSATKRPVVNWLALLAIAVLIGAVVWVATSKTGKTESADTAASTDPHGMAMGGSPHGEMSMDDVTNKLAEGKAKLKKNPLDVASLSQLYSMYGVIGQPDKVRPYTQAAVDEWKKRGKKEKDALRTLAGVAMAAMENGDHAGAALALVAYSEADPENKGVVVAIGNLHFEVSHEADAKGDAKAAKEAASEAVKWYDRYLKMRGDTDPDQEYWDVTVDRASMVLMADRDPASPQFKEVLSTLTDVTKRAPANWGAWHNLGLARELAGDKAGAVEALKTASKKAGDDLRRWESEKELARIEGRKAPPRPADPNDPHAGMNIGGSGSPHGGMGSPHGDMSNPHGEMGNPHGESGNPHGESKSPHGTGI